MSSVKPNAGGTRCDYLFQVPVEKLEREGKRSIGFRFAVGAPPEARKGVVRIRIFVDRNQGIGRQAALEQFIDLGLHPAVLHRHVQDEGTMQVLRLANIVLDISAVICDRAVDVGATAH